MAPTQFHASLVPERYGHMLANIYKEVMLNAISICANNSIKFEFYNAETGADMVSLLCRGVLMFKYSSSLLNDEELLPYFVLDVTYDEIGKSEVAECLKKNQYSFFQPNGEPTVIEEEPCYVFKIQGGAIDIVVICQEFCKE